jgi:tetratricopeptide (TPR) repeat protein
VTIAVRRACIHRVQPIDRRTSADSNAVRRGLSIGLLAFALQLLVDFHLKIPALAMAFAVVAALALGRPVPPPIHLQADRSGRVRTGWIVAGTFVVVSLFPLARFCRAEALRYDARQSLDAYTVSRAGDSLPMLDRAERDLSRATSLAPQHAAAWADFAFALELRAFAEPVRAVALAEPAFSAARRATELSPVVPEFWIRLGVAFDMQAQAALAEEAFGTAVRLAPQNSDAWYYYAYHLSLDTKTRESALRAIANSLSLDPGNAAAEALYVKLNGRSSGALFIP